MHDSFAQPEDSDPLEPLTDTFASDLLPHAMLALLGRIATALDDAAEWRQAHAVSRFDFHGRRGSADAEGLHAMGLRWSPRCLLAGAT
jgi:hypothetical protein